MPSQIDYAKIFNFKSITMNSKKAPNLYRPGLLTLLSVVCLSAILVASPNLFANCADKHGAPASTTQNAPYTKTLTLSGMSCRSCVKNVSTKLAPLQKSLGDQVTIKVDINTVTIDYSKNKNLTEEQLNKISTDLKSLLAQTKYKVVEG